VNRSKDDPRTTPKITGEAAEMVLKLAMAEKERDAAQSLADERAKTIDDLRDRLDKESEERRKMTAMLTDQRPRGFWSRLTGR
jgi:C4-type Zn-finger protein